MNYFIVLLLAHISAAITYKVVIKTGKQLGGSSTTAQSWMTLAGSIKDTGVMNIPKNENEFRFQVRNCITFRKYLTGFFLVRSAVLTSNLSHIRFCNCSYLV